MSHLPLLPSQGNGLLFEGNLSRPELFHEALSYQTIADLAARGVPPPEVAPPVSLAGAADGTVSGEFWQSGLYQLNTGESARVEVAEPSTLEGPWSVSFQENRGAPKMIVLPKLISLHRQSDPGVKFFSGLATYRHDFFVSPSWLQTRKRVVLDLGRVEVIAEVLVNGKSIGTLWKEPYQIDLTSAVSVGQNRLEVRVANLWANRLIGDESLPPENEYAKGVEKGILKLPDWYLKGEPKPPGGRVTFLTWHFYEANEPLTEAGLLGPVRLLNPVQQTFKK